MANKEIKLLIFSLNGEHYATNIMDVERILGYEAPTGLPDAPNFVDGVINYEDSILPIVNLSKKFGFATKLNLAETKIIVVKESGSKIGIIVDNVYEVKDVEVDLIENPPAIASNISRRYIKGLIRLKDNIVILLDLSKILTEEEKSKLL
ncbi:chemotaxis protein CheW [Clostridium sp. C8-1-8]|uniref:chemotaxis protein CheW n=1 Tax=Clostridium sp. C8-1-8 TaxID=2698831 RepID=UPI00136B59E8|nr:chemotaxis protein CheW [Clostridium sp. C8-1-8]